MASGNGTAGPLSVLFIAQVYGLPVEGLALLLGIDRFMSLGRAVVNTIGNAVAAVVVAKWDGDFDQDAWANAHQRRRALSQETVPAIIPGVGRF